MLECVHLPRLSFALLFAAVVPFAIACGGGSSSSSNSGGDGPRFLFTGPKGITEQTGKKERLLVHFDDGSFFIAPAISADGKKLAFAVQHPATADKNGKVDFGSDLYVSNYDGTGMKEILHHSAPGEFVSRPTWLPNDKQLLFDMRGTKPNNEPDL